MEEIPKELIALTDEIIEKSQKFSDAVSDPFLAFGLDVKKFENLSFEELNKLIQIEKRSGISPILQNITKFTTLVSRLFKFQQSGDFRDAIIITYRDSGISTLIKKSLKLIENSSIAKASFNGIIIFDVREFMVSSVAKTSVASFIHALRKTIATEEKSNDIGIIVIDHADYIVDSFVLFYEALKFQLPDKSIIFVLSPSAWLRLKSHLISIELEYYENFIISHLNPTTKSTVLNILNIKLTQGDKVLQPFTPEVLIEIANISEGSIKTAIRLTKRVCEECYYNNTSYATRTMVRDISALMGLKCVQDLHEIAAKEDSARLTIMAIITMKSIGFDIGATYEEIIENVDLQKSTISYHLTQLEKRALVIKRKINRKAYYRLNPILAPFSDRVLIPKFEQMDRYVKLHLP